MKKEKKTNYYELRMICLEGILKLRAKERPSPEK